MFFNIRFLYLFLIASLITVSSQIIALYEKMDLTFTLEQREQQRIIENAEARGQERLNTLVKFLLRDGSIQDLEKSGSDETYRQELYQEFHL